MTHTSTESMEMTRGVCRLPFIQKHILQLAYYTNLLNFESVTSLSTMGSGEYEFNKIRI